MSFEIKLPLFEGPFDLLLFFIERDELDIHDIPISKITDDFLDYIHHLEHLNLEVASEFILVAATLMRIKAKMLLPRPVFDEEGNEIDPREELVEHLLEYKKHKSVIHEFSALEGERIEKEKRGNIIQEIKSLSEKVNVESELQDVDLYKLLKVFQRALEKFELEKSKPIHTVVQYPYNISEQKKFILKTLQKEHRMSFEKVVSLQPDKIAVIFNFLAILEMINSHIIAIHSGIGYNNFWIERSKEEIVS